MKLKHPKVFLTEIQDSEHHIKVRWLIVFTTLAMVLVILVWMFYFQTTVRIAGPRTSPPDNQSVTP